MFRSACCHFAKTRVLELHAWAYVSIKMGIFLVHKTRGTYFIFPVVHPTSNLKNKAMRARKEGKWSPGRLPWSLNLQIVCLGKGNRENFPFIVVKLLEGKNCWTNKGKGGRRFWTGTGNKYLREDGRGLQSWDIILETQFQSNSLPFVPSWCPDSRNRRVKIESMSACHSPMPFPLSI